MALDSGDLKVLIQQLEADRQAYLSSHNKLQEALLRLLPGQAERGSVPSPSPSTPQRSATPSNQLEALNFPHQAISSVTSDLVSQKPASITSKRTAQSTLLEAGRRKITSVYSAEDSSDSEEGETFFAQNPLPSDDFSESQLRDHIRFHPWNDFSKLILGDLRRSGKLHRRDSIFEPDASDNAHDADHTHADIYEVGDDGAPLKRSSGDIKRGDSETWETLRTTNVDKERRQAVGRIIIMREPTALLFAALHLTMNKHFDMDSIYEFLIDDTISTKAYIKGHSMKDHRQQRAIVFSFHYHTLVGKDRRPLHFQNHDPDVHEKDDHLPLSTCSSIVALSLSGPPLRSYRRHSRRSKTPESSHVYDAFAPWHVLSLQCFPDWHSEVNLHETHHHYVNGVDAFLVTLLNEYRDAAKRFKAVTARIAKLATPLKEIVFNSSMRDNLLFETGDFVWSRRYFWAAQTLGIINDEIDAMIQAYQETFTDEVWAGEHKTLFPGTADTSARYTNWRKKMNHQRKLFEREMVVLKDISRYCDRELKDIKGLREWLFSGTSVQESRKAVEQASLTVEQGYNIKLLTLVTIFFLPLMFVTSVYGMTNMDPDESYIYFGITTVTICVPTYFLIGVINYETFQKTIAYLAWPIVWTVANTKKSMDWANRYRDRYMRRKKDCGSGTKPGRTMTRAQTFASLHHRLSMERSVDKVPQVSQETIEVEREKKAIDSDPEIAVPPAVLQNRENTIRWDTLPRTNEDSIVSEPSPNTSASAFDRIGNEQIRTTRETAERRERSRDQTSPRRSLLKKLSLKLGEESPKSPV